MQAVGHTLESLADGALESRPPSLNSLASTWSFDMVSHAEATGDALAEIERNRDIAKGTDAQEFAPVVEVHEYVDSQGQVRTFARTVEHESVLADPDALDHERYVEDMLALAKAGGERRYEDEQGFAPVVLQPGFDQWADGSWHVNDDAKAAALHEQLSRPTSIDMPFLSQRRRHWRDAGQDEDRAALPPFEAETRALVDPDALAGHVNRGFARRDLFAELSLESLVEVLDDATTDGSNSREYLRHLRLMASHQVDALVRERERARALQRAHDPGHLQWREVDGPDGEVRRVPVGPRPGDPPYRRWCKPWRLQNERRKALWARRAGRGGLRSALRPLPPNPAESDDPFAPHRSWRVWPRHFVAGPVGPPTVVPERVVPVKRFCLPPSRPVALPPVEQCSVWWQTHGKRLCRLVFEWDESLRPPLNAMLVMSTDDRPFDDDEWWDDDNPWWAAAQDAYYVLRVLG